MLNPQEVATYITDKLNAKAQVTTTANGWHPTFSLLAETAKGHEKATVEGMLVTVSEEILPVLDGFKQVLYTYRAQFFFASLTNREYVRNKAIIESVIAEQQGSEVDFESGKGVITFNGGTPGKTFSGSSYGSGVQYEFTVSVAYTENAVSSGQKHWLLDGVEIPFLSESVTVETEGAPRKIFSEVYSKALITGKTKYYTFRIPYESGTYKQIQQEIMNSVTIGVVHTLSYYDGEAFTQEKPFTAKVSIHRTASSSSTRPNGSVYEVTFSDIYEKDKNALKYSIALINFPFDMYGDDTRYFKSTQEQFDYFEDKATDSSAPFVEIMAPNLDNLVITQQLYYNPKASAITQFDYASKNYAIVKVEDTSVTPTETRHYYYFIEKATIGAGGYVLCDLRLDTVQTYFFREDITFSDCLIERAHLNRFERIDFDSPHVRFVSDPASKIFNTEDGLNFPKRLVSREKLQLSFTETDPNNTEINYVDQWLNKNVAYWVYVFIDPSVPYNSVDKNDENKEITANARLTQYPIGFNGAVGCFCYPIYKTGYKIYIGNQYYLGYEGREAFETLNAESSYYYSIKISIIPPFDIMGKTTNVPHDGIGNMTIVPESETNGNPCLYKFGDNYAIRVKSDKKYYMLIWGSVQHKTSIFQFSKIHLEENKKIEIKDIAKAQEPQIRFNPKLNGQSFKELVITASSGDTFTYDIQKLVDDDVGFEYTEPIVSEITKYYLRITGGTGLYTEGTENNYTGLVGSTDNGLAFVNDQYAAFIANNKNFYLQSNLKIGASAASGIVGGVASALAGNYGGAAAQIGGSIFQAGMSAIDRSLTVDNMKNAPDQLKNANGNVIFNLFSMSDAGDELGLYAEKYSALEGDLKTANSYMDLFGFSFNDVASVKYYANMRKFHSYVKAQLQSINGNVNNTARNDLRQRFANGVRFWNVDLVSYVFENYELFFEGEAEKDYTYFWVTPITRYDVYYTEYGATWSEFVQSNNNTGEFTISGQTVFRNKFAVTYNGTAVLPSDIIRPRGEYTAK